MNSDTAWRGTFSFLKSSKAGVGIFVPDTNKPFFLAPQEQGLTRQGAALLGEDRAGELYHRHGSGLPNERTNSNFRGEAADKFQREL